MDVAALAEGLGELLVPREVREDAELDLAVVGGEQDPAAVLVGLAGDEGRAQATSALGADRDVLQVRLAGGSDVRRGDRLAEGAVDPPGRTIDEAR